MDGLALAQVPGAPDALTGTVSLDATVETARADLAALQGRLEFGALDVSLDGLTLAQERPTTMMVENGEARLEPAALSGTLGRLDLDGRLGLTGERPIDARVDGNLDMGAVGIVSDTVTADGTATVNVAAGGTLESPDLKGTVQLADATVVVDEPTVAAENLNARLDLDGARLDRRAERLAERRRASRGRARGAGRGRPSPTPTCRSARPRSPTTSRLSCAARLDAAPHARRRDHPERDVRIDEAAFRTTSTSTRASWPRCRRASGST
ncbi:MAG: hypothetical protein R2712_19440 [Vicinamibacterales bacterium]